MANITDPVGGPSPIEYSGTRRRSTFLYTGPVSYVNPGGDPITAAEVRLGAIDYMPTMIAFDGASVIRLLVWDYTLNAFKWFIPNTGAEVANAVNLSTFFVRIEAWGH
jgi:hypothetical protein